MPLRSGAVISPSTRSRPLEDPPRLLELGVHALERGVGLRVADRQLLREGTRRRGSRGSRREHERGRVYVTKSETASTTPGWPRGRASEAGLVPGMSFRLMTYASSAASPAPRTVSTPSSSV